MQQTGAISGCASWTTPERPWSAYVVEDIEGNKIACYLLPRRQYLGVTFFDCCEEAVVHVASSSQEPARTKIYLSLSFCATCPIATRCDCDKPVKAC